MSIADAVAGARRPGQQLTWLRTDGTPEDLTGATLSGVLLSLSTQETRAIVGIPPPGPGQRGRVYLGVCGGRCGGRAVPGAIHGHLSGRGHPGPDLSDLMDRACGARGGAVTGREERMTCRRAATGLVSDAREQAPAGHALMAVAPAEKALLLLIRARGHGELTLVFRGDCPPMPRRWSSVFIWASGRGRGSEAVKARNTYPSSYERWRQYVTGGPHVWRAPAGCP